MRIATLTSSTSRQAGGLFYSVRHLSQALCKGDTSAGVIGLRDACTDEDRDAWEGVSMKVGGVWGPAAFGFAPVLKRELFHSSAELLHLHGLWMYPSWLALKWSRSARRPVVVSPRGMLDPWALRNSAWKKFLAGWLYEKRNLRSAACIHALCESEYRSIRAYGLKNPVCIIPNGITLPDPTDKEVTPPWEPRVGRDKNVMLFLGRIHPKKGLQNLIRAWALLQQSAVSSQYSEWVLVIAGWSQGGHEDELKKLVCELNLETNILFAGPLYDTAKDAALRAAKAFVLPSFSEGLPMAVLEAWSYGLPVVMTKECNLPEGFRAQAACKIRPEIDSIVETLKDFMDMPEREQQRMGQNGFELARDTFAWPKIAADMLDVYRWVLGQASRPDCVKVN